MKEVHILNGDSLREQFPSALPGDILVARECLIDGDLKGESLESFFENRATWLSQHYGGSPEEYHEKTKSQFESMQQLPPDSVVNLWFEEDLFCQANLWFVCHLLRSRPDAPQSIFLVMPKGNLEYGFSALNETGLTQAYEARQSLSALEVNALASMWEYYRSKEVKSMFVTVDDYRNTLPFLSAAVQAYEDSLPNESGIGKPQQVLQEILNELDEPNFGEAFQRFQKRLPIYGYGDLQVKRMWDDLVSS